MTTKSKARFGRRVARCGNCHARHRTSRDRQRSGRPIAHRARPAVRSRSALAQAAAQPLAARHDHRRLGRRVRSCLDHPSRRGDAACQRARARPQGRRVLHGGPAGAGIRPGGQPGARLGRPRPGLRMAGIESRHPRRLQGQRLDRRQRPEGRAHPQIHQGRQVPDAGRGLGQERGQQRPGKLRPRRQDLGRPEDQRSLRRRRLPQQARRRARCRHRQDEALLGRLRQQAGRHRPWQVRPESAAAAAVPQPGALRRAHERRVSSTSATAPTTACRCSAPTAPS